MLYNRHGVAEIAEARADVGNLGRTTDAIRHAVETARAELRHEVLFVTGIPGAGKTLCGLNAVFRATSGAAFLTGNLPLVHVMREALARDAHEQGGSLRMARQKTESAIQPLMGFLRDSIDRSEPPHEHVIVFDEAQRAWDAAFGRRKFGRTASEAALFLDIMRRHPDWAVIIALVGSGQEINTGEAGLAAWGEALAERPTWHVRAAPGVLGGADPRQRLFAAQPATMQVDAALHLNVAVRSIRSAEAAPWVDAVLAGDAQRASAVADAAGGIPYLLTRSLPAMRAVLRRARARYAACRDGMQRRCATAGGGWTVAEFSASRRRRCRQLVPAPLARRSCLGCAGGAGDAICLPGAGTRSRGSVLGQRSDPSRWSRRMGRAFLRRHAVAGTARRGGHRVSDQYLSRAAHTGALRDGDLGAGGRSRAMRRVHQRSSTRLLGS